MGYLERDQTVTMKGRVACEVNSGAPHLHILSVVSSVPLSHHTCLALSVR